MKFVILTTSGQSGWTGANHSGNVQIMLFGDSHQDRTDEASGLIFSSDRSLLIPGLSTSSKPRFTIDWNNVFNGRGPGRQ
jgi:hypothetical protein